MKHCRLVLRKVPPWMFLSLESLPPETQATTSNYVLGSGSAAPSPKPATKTATVLLANTKSTVHVTALDSIVNINSLFAVAVFLGLSLSAPNLDSSSGNGCLRDSSDVNKLLVYEESILSEIDYGTKRDVRKFRRTDNETRASILDGGFFICSMKEKREQWRS
ncbi:hypothetical protein LguiB_030915 [Lonicera macranthoides]